MSAPNIDKAISHARKGNFRALKPLLKVDKLPLKARLVGNALLEKGEAALAIDVFRKVLASSPSDLGVVAGLARAFAKVDDYDSVQSLLASVGELVFETEGLIRMYVIACLKTGSLKEAVQAAERMQTEYSTSPECLEVCGQVQERKGSVGSAVNYYKKSIQLDSSRKNAYWSLIRLLLKQSKWSLADKIAQTSLKIFPNDSELLRLYSHALFRNGDMDGAKEALSKVIKMNPEDSKSYDMLSSIYMVEGEFELAKETSVLVEKYGGKSLMNLHSRSKKIGVSGSGDFTESDVVFLESTALDESAREYDRALANYALSNFYKAKGDTESEWLALERASNYVKIHRNYDSTGKNSAERVSRKIELITKKQLAAENGNSTQEANPIFIVGMPRSGSTLIEQILSSHGDVVGLGEVFSLHNAIKGKLKSSLREKENDTPVGTIMKNYYTQVADDYLEDTQNLHDGARSRTVDKMLNNYQVVNIIHKAFPRAKIIHSMRHPVGCSLSIYRELFRSSNLAYSFDIDWIADEYIAYSKLMKHWHQIMPGVIYDVEYEKLVNNPKEVVESLLDYCELEWDDKCMSFHENTRNVHTASLVQVRQPLYKSSARSWEKYQQFVPGLLEKYRHENLID